MATASAAAESATTQQAYEKLCSKLKELSALNGISGLLGWDEMVRACCRPAAHWCAAARCACAWCGREVRPRDRSLLAALRPQVMMPPGAAESRAAQKAALAGVIYDKVAPAQPAALFTPAA